MKRFITLCAAVAMAFMMTVPATADEGGVSVAKGNLAIKAIFQADFRIFQSAGAEDTELNDSFNYNRFRLLLIGKVAENVKYIYQGDMLSAPFLDGRMIFLNAFSNTDIQVGRFLPNFTYYMPQLVTNLDFIDYPLLVSQWAMWRQVGVQSTTKFGAHSLDVGILNSIITPNTVSDSDNWKDFLVRLNLAPNKAKVGIYALLGQTWTTDPTQLEEPGYYLSMKLGGFVRATIEKLLAQAEVLYAMDNFDPDSVSGLGLYAMVGYDLSEKVQALARFEMNKPDLDVAEGEPDLGKMRIAAGINYYIVGKNAFIQVNFYEDLPDAEGADAMFTLKTQANVQF